jgi:hypothetical protein
MKYLFRTADKCVGFPMVRSHNTYIWLKSWADKTWMRKADQAALQNASLSHIYTSDAQK